MEILDTPTWLEGGGYLARVDPGEGKEITEMELTEEQLIKYGDRDVLIWLINYKNSCIKSLLDR
jgi:hypothetical protein